MRDHDLLQALGLTAETLAWVRYAACRGLAPEQADAMFFDLPRRRKPGPVAAMCTRCPVADDCAALALSAERGVARGYRHGIFGGLTPRDREDLADAAAREAS